MFKVIFAFIIIFHVNCFSFNLTLDEIKTYIHNLDLDVDLEIEFRNMNVISNINLKGIGNSTIYEIFIPEYDKVHSNGYAKIIIIKSKSNLYYEICTNYFLFKINEKEGYLIGTTYYFRGNSFFGINKYENNTNKVLFSSSPNHILRSSLDCFDYKNFILDFKNIDLNNDEYLDIEFSGIKYLYCKEFEIGPSKEDTKPLDSLKIDIKIIYDPKSENWKSEYNEFEIK